MGNPLSWRREVEGDADFIEKHYASGVIGSFAHTRVLAYRGLDELLQPAGFQEIEVGTRGYLPLWGILSDVFPRIDRTHGHFVVASAIKP